MLFFTAVFNGIIGVYFVNALVLLVPFSFLSLILLFEKYCLAHGKRLQLSVKSHDTSMFLINGFASLWLYKLHCLWQVIHSGILFKITGKIPCNKHASCNCSSMC